MAALVLSACQVTTQVDINVTAAGNGVVSVAVQLDRDAAKSVPDLASELRVSDLTQTGWRVDGPRPAGNGGLVVTASKPFRDPAEAEQVLAEVSGSSGPFHDLRLSRRQSTFGARTTVRVHGTIDLTCGLQCFSDPALQQQLGSAIGPNVGAGTFAFRVTAHLPGKTAAWQPKLGDKMTLAATGEAWDVTRIVVGAIAAGAVVVLLGGLAWFGLRRRRRRGRRAF